MEGVLPSAWSGSHGVDGYAVKSNWLVGRNWAKKKKRAGSWKNHGGGVVVIILANNTGKGKERR